MSLVNSQSLIFNLSQIYKILEMFDEYFDQFVYFEWFDGGPGLTKNTTSILKGFFYSMNL